MLWTRTLEAVWGQRAARRRTGWGGMGYLGGLRWSVCLRGLGGMEEGLNGSFGKGRLQSNSLDLPTPFPSFGEVPSEFPPFKFPYFVATVGRGSNEILQTTPPGTLKP